MDSLKWLGQAALAAALFLFAGAMFWLHGFATMDPDPYWFGVASVVAVLVGRHLWSRLE